MGRRRNDQAGSRKNRQAVNVKAQVRPLLTVDEVIAAALLLHLAER